MIVRRCLIKFNKTGKVLEGRPSGFGVFAEDGNFYHKTQYKVIKLIKVNNDHNSISSQQQDPCD